LADAGVTPIGASTNAIAQAAEIPVQRFPDNLDMSLTPPLDCDIKNRRQSNFDCRLQSGQVSLKR
jgi:hypothetical protein